MSRHSAELQVSLYDDVNREKYIPQHFNHYLQTNYYCFTALCYYFDYKCFMHILLIQKKNDLANQAQAPAAAGNARGAARRGTKRKGGDEWNDI